MRNPFIANMAVAILSQMYRLAEGWGLVPEGCNPCRLAVKFPERKRERFPTDGEFIRLGTVLLKFFAHDNVDSVMHDKIYQMATIDAGTKIFNKQ